MFEVWLTMRWRMLAICSLENWEVVQSATINWAMEVGWCSTLLEARRGLQRGGHSLVLCEAELPDGTYHDVMRLLQYKPCQTRVIVLSNSPAQDCYHQAIAMGVFDVIPAPTSRTDIQWTSMQAVQGCAPAPAPRERIHPVQIMALRARQ